MISSDSLRFPASRWDDMRVRLQPLLGDIRVPLGPRWHEKAEALFTQADFAVASAVLRAPSRPDWFVIRYAPAGLRLDENEDGLACASSWVEAVAVLLHACESCRLLPSRVEQMEESRTLHLYAGDALLATVEPARFDPVRTEYRLRALGTVCGLRKFRDPSAELLKRVRRWPGLSNVYARDGRVPPDMQAYRESMAHQPIPREWLMSAKRLIASCGNDSPGTAEVQAVAAAAMGAQSWNHLAGLLGDRSARLLQPWHLRVDGQVRTLHADAIDAVASLLSSAASAWTPRWSGATFESWMSFTALDYIPTYTLVERREGVEFEKAEPGEIAAYPVARASTPPDSVLDRVGRLTVRRTQDIAALFGIGLQVEARARILDACSNETLIVQEGRWRFTRAGDPGSTSALLWVNCVGEHGNSLWSEAVPTYKGLLQTHRESGMYVLCADYDGAHPVAVIDGLSASAAAQVRSHLPDTAEHRMEFREEGLRPRDHDAFSTLIKRARSRHHTVC